MHFDLKSISVESIPEALKKVERYRLLNEPTLAESICLDILAIVPDHQQALISLLLARTDGKAALGIEMPRWLEGDGGELDELA